MVSDVTFSSALGQQENTANSSTGLAKDFSQFLTLLTTQLQNQDPMSPMDTADFTNQLVMFSGVEQQINMNQKLDSLVSLQLANGFSAALGYVGMDVSFVSSDVPFDGSAPVKIHYALESEASEATINIRDESGNAIYTADALTSTGKHDFTWDGTLNGGGLAEPGTYTVTIDAFDSEGSLVNSSTVVTGRVRGVETQNGSLFVLVGDRAVSIGSILNASEPETSTTTNTTTI